MANHLNYPAMNILDGLIQSTRGNSHNKGFRMGLINALAALRATHLFVNTIEIALSIRNISYINGDIIVKANCLTSRATAIESRDERVMMPYKKPLKAEVFGVCVALGLIEQSKYSAMMNGKVTFSMLNSLLIDYSKSDTILQSHRTIQPTANHRDIQPTLNHREIQNFPEHLVIQHSTNYREIQQRQDVETQRQYQSDMEQAIQNSTVPPVLYHRGRLVRQDYNRHEFVEFEFHNLL